MFGVAAVEAERAAGVAVVRGARDKEAELQRERRAGLSVVSEVAEMAIEEGQMGIVGRLRRQQPGMAVEVRIGFSDVLLAELCSTLCGA